ncbi:hypothetical protein F528_1849 [Neisseria meningitidis 992008]|nr:hypothetical protein F528_1849 [Neisseria meningitidis 992008]
MRSGLFFLSGGVPPYQNRRAMPSETSSFPPLFVIPAKAGI